MVLGSKYETNGKLMVLGVPILKHIGVKNISFDPHKQYLAVTEIVLMTSHNVYFH